MQLLRYFANLRPGKIALWCYLIWYFVTVAHLFEPSLSLWLNSAGISAVIGIALKLSVAGGHADRWQTFRLFAMPFCVSSFSALIKGQGYFLVFPNDVRLLTQSVLSCAAFLLACVLLRWVLKPKGDYRESRA
jgi:predicted MFS family arabinose efflux permease